VGNRATRWVFVKKRQKCITKHFHNNCKTFWLLLCVTFPKLPIVNNGPMGENSPNLVTLVNNYLKIRKKLCSVE
jgi:hypothetical protein